MIALGFKREFKDEVYLGLGIYKNILDDRANQSLKQLASAY
jgi:hypothetical protein